MLNPILKNISISKPYNSLKFYQIKIKTIIKKVII